MATYLKNDRSDNNRLLNITTSKPCQPILNLSYLYDYVGNVTAITDNNNANQTQNFIYDDIDRLLQAQSNAYGPKFYSYDQIGNFTTWSNDSGSSASYGLWNSVFCGDRDKCWDTSYDSCNNDSTNAYTCQPGFVGTWNDTANYYYSDDDSGAYWDYRTVTCGGATNITYTYGTKPHAVTSTTDGKTYTYDPNGNMLTDSQRTFTYNYDNMPATITYNNVTSD